ncbi:hypothetical protein OH77DRAFT_171055 [Trametes cingulata]|nr:hypothetical protein OH77DRAFT_171055 [Trametes cingulata]
MFALDESDADRPIVPHAALDPSTPPRGRASPAMDEGIVAPVVMERSNRAGQRRIAQDTGRSRKATQTSGVTMYEEGQSAGPAVTHRPTRDIRASQRALGLSGVSLVSDPTRDLDSTALTKASASEQRPSKSRKRVSTQPSEREHVAKKGHRLHTADNAERGESEEGGRGKGVRGRRRARGHRR